MAINPRQSTQLRQAEIIATMVRLAAERNPADITTTDIANAMSVTQGALFRHFSTKEAIRLAVVEWIEEQLMAELHDAQRAASDALGALRAMFMAHVAFTRTYPGVPRLIFAELQQPDTSPVRQRVQHLMQGYRTTVTASLTAAAGAQRIRPDVDCPSAAALFLGAIQGLVIQSMLGGSAAQIEQRAEGVLAIYLAGLGAES
ncbi:MAG: TetR/AcrR family transcriptional regulator [Rhodocyclaceae bacterium]|nr:TetR/AcrR family transcriptional regulator [Rhodocyclaceae bacterium]MBK6905719.1 TetR/AcrR family transcriptional regulator [Rhodocyclaceae bacterium]